MKISYRNENDELKTININFLDMIKIFLSVSILGTLVLWIILFIIFFIIGIFAGIGSLLI